MSSNIHLRQFKKVPQFQAIQKRKCRRILLEARRDLQKNPPENLADLCLLIIRQF